MQKLIEMKNKKGFTLIEMLIVILIIVILLAIAVPAVAAYRRDALRTQDEGAVETILTALEAALIRETPVSDGGHNGPNQFHESAYLDYAALATPDTTLPQETQDFYKLVGEYLGPNFQGNFKFIYNTDHYPDEFTISRNGIAMIAYWRSDSATSEDSVMMYYPIRTEEILYYSEIKSSLNDNLINNIIRPIPCLD